MTALRDAFNSLAQGRFRASANWDPSYPHEHADYYDEYIRRHAPINVGWLSIPSPNPGNSSEPSEATGVAVLRQDASDIPKHVVAPLDDGSICIWDVSLRDSHRPIMTGKLIGQSSLGLLSGTSPSTHKMANTKALMTETGAVESVSIDSSREKAFFARGSTLVEVDLQTLQAVSQEPYPFPITALSPAHQFGLVVGTNNTLHLHDSRNRSRSSLDPSLTVEIIGGPPSNHAVLSQPGPLSIINRVGDDSIWVAGRFTHLLNYDRRFFPRLRGTVHSGARISCISTLPTPDNAVPGTTLLTAGEYKGKGSLEFYHLTPSPTGPRVVQAYQNRQTASSTKLLSVASHGLSTVFSDGNGNLKWIERDGSTPIRSYNINPDSPPSFNQAQSAAQALSSNEDPAQGDIVQKIVPLSPGQVLTQSTSRLDVNQSDLLLKTGDGKLGILGFGHKSLVVQEQIQLKAQTIEEAAKQDAERQYQDTLKRALQRNADEVRFMKGLGLAFGVTS